MTELLLSLVERVGWTNAVLAVAWFSGQRGERRVVPEHVIHPVILALASCTDQERRRKWGAGVIDPDDAETCRLWLQLLVVCDQQPQITEAQLLTDLRARYDAALLDRLALRALDYWPRRIAEWSEVEQPRRAAPRAMNRSLLADPLLIG